MKRRMKMKKLTILICVLAILLASTGVASASPAQPKKFRIKGHTTIIDLTTFSITSEGKVIQHIQGTFSMQETVIPLNQDLTEFLNFGILTITTKKGDAVVIDFSGSSDNETVQGTFEVTGGTGAYQGFTGGGAYEGIADECVLPCDPTQPGCGPIFDMPDCEGFYVDFTFTD
jgi:hypothetical protein